VQLLSGKVELMVSRRPCIVGGKQRYGIRSSRARKVPGRLMWRAIDISGLRY